MHIDTLWTLIDEWRTLPVLFLFIDLDGKPIDVIYLGIGKVIKRNILGVAGIAYA